ncbi:hypothetical protein Tco_0594680 [Tanacetum coccineum]
MDIRDEISLSKGNSLPRSSSLSERRTMSGVVKSGDKVFSVGCEVSTILDKNSSFRNCWESWEWHERWQEFQKLDQGKVIEEGILGVYEATIACDPVDDRGSLVKFILTDQKPTGMKENLEIKLGTLLSIEEIQFNMSKRLKFKYATSSTTTWKKLSYDNHGESESDGIKSG